MRCDEVPDDLVSRLAPPLVELDRVEAVELPGAKQMLEADIGEQAFRRPPLGRRAPSAGTAQEPLKHTLGRSESPAASRHVDEPKAPERPEEIGVLPEIRLERRGCDDALVDIAERDDSAVATGHAVDRDRKLVHEVAPGRRSRGPGTV